MGVDFFDSFSATMAARNDTFLFPTGFYKKNQLPEIPCCCPTCVTTNDVSSMGYEEIVQHNYSMLFTEMKLVRNAITIGSLRELVETRVRTKPHLAALLHILDLNHYQFLEERTPVVRKQPLIATTKDSLVRPEIRRFQDRVIERFEKPASAKILLLLPCSAKKPYSFSKSHKLFRECFLNQANPFVVHEVILTSPLGLVPRELELTYPASIYDIAVTGHWDEDEKKMMRTLLQGYLEKNTYDATILHIPPVMQTFVSDLLKNPQVTCKDSPTSAGSISALSNALQELTQRFDRVKPQRRAYENITSLACYQFGPALAKLLMKDCTISGKYPYQKIMDKNIQLGMLTEERGLLSLTMDGANRLGETEHYWVEISDDFTLKGSVFAPGIKDADVSIRIGEEVLVKKKNRLCGVGVALMNGKEMIESTHGEAVKIRHHI
jgi:archaeosine synthase